MKKFFIFLVALAVNASTVLAQDDIKRPDSFNYQSGVDAYGNQDYATSLDYFDKELQQNPKNGYAFLYEAYIYNDYEKYGDAMKKANDAIKYLPKKDKEWVAMGYGIRGDIYASLGDSVKALQDYDQAFKVGGDCKYIFDRCNIYNVQGRFDDEAKEIARAMKVNENDAVTWTYAGRNEHSKGNYEAAIEKYNYSARLDPKYSSAYSFRADTYIAMGKYREAAQDVVQALSIDYAKKSYYQMFAVADSAYALMVQQLKAQQQKDLNNAVWSYYVGKLQMYKNDYASAEQSYRSALKISDDAGSTPIVIKQELAGSLNELGRFSEALELLDECEAQDSTDVDTYAQKADVLYNMGRNMESIECLNKYVTLAPSSARAFCKRARMYMYAGMNKNALDDIETAVALDPEESFYKIQRAEIHKRMGNDADAVTDCKEVIAAETAKPDDEQDRQALAYAYVRMGDKTNAYNIIDKVYEGNESNGSEYDVACMYSLLDNKDEALKHFEKALQMGYCEFVHIGNDTDLDNIRGTEKFKSLVDEYKAKYTDGAQETTTAGAEYVDVVTEVPFTKDSGICKVKCTINDLPLCFYFDTGAADVTISSVEALFMLKNDYLKSSDIKGKAYYGDANGDISEGTVILLKKVEFGGLELTNVKASVVHNQKAPLLLGQSVLSRLGKIEIDNSKSIIKITSKKRK